MRREGGFSPEIQEKKQRGRRGKETPMEGRK